ncbi:MAG TPA: hypothetical protein P5136_00305 [Methanofastidiosum sp.]|nr:hypothetical protein [Methanofastidiosum sp.]
MRTENIEKMIKGISDFAVKNAIDAADSVSMTLTPDYVVVKFKNAQTLPMQEGAAAQTQQIVPQNQPVEVQQSEATQQPAELVQPQETPQTQETPQNQEVVKAQETAKQLGEKFQNTSAPMQSIMDQVKQMMVNGATEDQIKQFVESQQNQVVGDIDKIVSSPDFNQISSNAGIKAEVPQTGAVETAVAPETTMGTETPGTTPAPGQGIPTGA